MDPIDALLVDDDEMDQLFQEAFDNIDMCRKTVDKMRPGASVSQPLPQRRIMHGVWCPRERGAVRKGFPGG